MSTDMKPGRALDAAVAERVMGWVRTKNLVGRDLWAVETKHGIQIVDFVDGWSPSTDWRAAGEVEAKMAADGWYLHISRSGTGYWAHYNRSGLADGEETAEHGETLAHAICLAARAALARLAACEGEGR